MEEQNALYLKSWLKPLKDNPKILCSIFSEASKAYNYILEEIESKEEVTFKKKKSSFIVALRQNSLD